MLIKKSIINQIFQKEIGIVDIASSNGVTTFYIDDLRKVLELLRMFNHEIIIDAHFDEVHVFSNLERILIFRQTNINSKHLTKFKNSQLFYDNIKYQGNSENKLDDDSLNLLSFS